MQHFGLEVTNNGLKVFAIIYIDINNIEPSIG